MLKPVEIWEVTKTLCDIQGTIERETSLDRNGIDRVVEGLTRVRQYIREREEINHVELMSQWEKELEQTRLEMSLMRQRFQPH